MKKQIIFAILVISILACLCSCGTNTTTSANTPGGGQTPSPTPTPTPTPTPSASSVSISGRLGTGYNVSARKLFSKNISVNVTAICAVPYSPAHLWEMSTYLMQTQIGAIQSDESFSLALDKNISKNWILLLLDTTEAQKIDQVKGYIAVKVDDSNNLIQFSLDTANSSIGLGTLETSANSLDEAQTTQTAEAASFNLTTAKLLEMAKTDETLKGLKNLYANFNPATQKYYFIDPVYLWEGGSQATINNQYPDPAAIFSAANKVYYFYLKTNKVDYDPNDVLNHASNLTLTPPSPVDIANVDFSGIRSPGVETLTDEAAYATFESSGVIISEWLYFKGQVPSGKWVEKVGNTAVCTFDLSATYASDEAGNPKIYVPVIQVTTTPTNLVTAIDIKWYLNTGSGFEPVTDLSTLAASLGGNIMLWLSAGPGVIDEYHYFGGTTTRVDTFDHAWTFPRSASGDNVLKSITIDYNRNFVGYRLQWDKD